MISFRTSGSYKETKKYLQKLSRGDFYRGLDKYAQEGVNALTAATPIYTGLVAGSWGYKIEMNRASCTITWMNSDIESGFPVSIMLQYGFATGTGGYVQGQDYINPAMRPIFDKIENQVRKAVTSK